MRAHLITSPHPLLLISLPVSYPLASPDALSHTQVPGQVHHGFRVAPGIQAGGGALLADGPQGSVLCRCRARAVHAAGWVLRSAPYPGRGEFLSLHSAVQDGAVHAGFSYTVPPYTAVVPSAGLTLSHMPPPLPLSPEYPFPL